MSSTPLFQALLLLACVIVLILATQSRHFHPFLAIVVIASTFGFAAGLPFAAIGKDFGTGFSETVYSPGLVIVAAGFVSGLAESTTASGRIMASIDPWRWLGSTGLAAFLGLIAGVGASPSSAFAILTPFLRAAGGGTTAKRESASVALALAISASHGLVWLAPVPIGAAAILGADWHRVALFGLPVAILSVAIGGVMARWVSNAAGASQLLMTEARAATEKRNGGSTMVLLLLATAVPLLMLMVRSLGDIPSEPLGGGPTRGMILALGEPLILFLTGVGIVIIGIMIMGHWRLSAKRLAEPSWMVRILGDVSGLLLTVGAAGGLQKLCQETGMAELLGERLAGWQVGTHGGEFGGLLVPFLVAASIKTLQGSSLVAAITAAGMLQPILASLGMGEPNGTALAALAIGAGAMTVCHVNDDYFWLVAGATKLSPLRGIAALTLGTLLQGLIAVAALVLMAMTVGSH